MPSFINPYHFIPLSAQAPSRKAVKNQRGDLQGCIECTLTLKSPLALPDHERDTEKQLNYLDNNGNKKTGKNGKPITFQHKESPFYSVDGKLPMIPGSELKGMIRSVFEAETNSCMGVFDNSQLTGRSQITKNKGGLLYKKGNQWYLQPADVFAVNTFLRVNKQDNGRSQPSLYCIDYSKQELIANNRRYFNGSKVSFTPSSYTYVTSRGAHTQMSFANDLGNGSQEGWLLIGERGLTTRHNSHILKPSADKAPFPIPGESVENLQAVLDLYAKKEINKALGTTNHSSDVQHTGYLGYSIKSDGRKNPVFYSVVGKHYYFSPAMKGREVYYRKLHDIAGEHISCGLRSAAQTQKVDAGLDELCPACALFGALPDNSSIRGKQTILKNSYGSAVRFSDAVWQGDAQPKWLMRNGSNWIALPELSGPKITSSEFYTHLNPPNTNATGEYKGSGIWNMDYKTINQQKEKDGRQLKVSEMYALSPNEVQLNGRKFYWHHPVFASSTDQANLLQPQKDIVTGRIETQRNITTQVLKDGIFRFTVFFDGISPETLNDLLWAVSPKADNRMLYHKLGFGKPLGLGSVEVKIEQLKIRSYKAGHYDEEKNCNELINSRKANTLTPYELIEMLDFYRTGAYSVTYPVGQENGTISDGALIWFKYNRSIGTTAERPAVNFVLPKIQKDNPNAGFDLILPSVSAQNRQGYFEALQKKHVLNGSASGQTVVNAASTAPQVSARNEQAKSPTTGECSSCRKNNVPLYPYMFGKMICDECRKKLSIK